MASMLVDTDLTGLSFHHINEVHEVLCEYELDVGDYGAVWTRLISSGLLFDPRK